MLVKENKNHEKRSRGKVAIFGFFGDIYFDFCLQVCDWIYSSLAF